MLPYVEHSEQIQNTKKAGARKFREDMPSYFASIDVQFVFMGWGGLSTFNKTTNEIQL